MKANISKDKLKDLILYILTKTGKIPKVKLAKLILFSELEYFKKNSESFTGLYFVRLKNGPVIAFLDEVLEKGTNTLWEKKEEFIPIYEEGIEKKQISYSAAVKNINIPEKIGSIIAKVIKHFGKKTGTELSKISHSLPAWKYSEPNEPIYIAELSIEKEPEYFALIDLLEDTEDDDAKLAEKIPRPLSSM